MNDASCRNALAAFVEVRIEDWTGLPERGCAPELLQEPMPEERVGRGMARLGRRRAMFGVRTAPAFTEGVRCWEIDDRVVLLDGRPRLDRAPTPADLLQRLGEPEFRLDYRFGRAPIEGGEWVYPERGLAVFVDGEAAQIYRLAGFPLTDREGYRNHYRPNLATA